MLYSHLAAIRWGLVGALTAAGCTNLADANPRSLQGDASAPAAAAIPALDYEPRARDFRDDHPDYPGLPRSFNTLLLVFQLGTTVEAANALLTDLDAEIAGGLPGVTDSVEGILVVRLPTVDHAELAPVVDRLAKRTTAR